MPTFLPKLRKFLIENRVFIMVIGFLMSEEIRRLTRTIVDNLKVRRYWSKVFLLMIKSGAKYNYIVTSG